MFETIILRRGCERRVGTMLFRAVLFFGFTALLGVSRLFGESEDGKVVITISIPMDSKPDTETGHVVLEYFVFESGLAVSIHNVYGWAHQASHNERLTKEQLEKVKSIVQHLPARSDKVLKERSVIVVENMSEEKKERIYDRTKLPASMKELFSLLGGIRFEVRNDLKFEQEPPERAASK